MYIDLHGKKVCNELFQNVYCSYSHYKKEERLVRKLGLLLFKHIVEKELSKLE